MQFFDLRSGIHGHPAVVSAYLLGFAALAVLTAPFWWWRRRDLTGAGRLLVASATLLFAWALLRALQGRMPRMVAPHIGFPRSYLVVPVLTSLAALFAAWGVALATRRADRRELVWRASMLLAVSTVLAWPRSAIANHTYRLATGLGGAAVYHVVLLLALGQLLGAVLAGHRRLWSSIGAVICIVGILLTGSRAGLICLFGFAVLVGLWFALRGQARLVVPLIGGLLALVGLFVALVPAGRHLLQTSDRGRTLNMDTATRVFNLSWHNRLVGVGTGRLWPWYPFETGRAKVPWSQIIVTNFGRTMTNPHSVALGVLVELGLVGVVLLVGLVLVLLVQVLRTWRASASAQRTPELVRDVVGQLALVSTLPAFLFDYYLFKNFGISFWWWLVLAFGVGVVRPGAGAGAAPSTVATTDPTIRESLA